MTKVVRGMLLIVASVVGFAVAGCGDGGPRLYKAEGTVTLDGQPVEGANVIALYTDETSAVGITDASGNFALSYGNKVGAKPGSCKIVITKFKSSSTMPAPSKEEMKDPANMTKAMAGMMKGKNANSGNAPTPNELPAKYASAGTSGFTWEIGASSEKKTFALTKN